MTNSIVSRWLPHASVDLSNPIFRLTHLTDADFLRQRTWRWLLWGIAPVLVVWMLYFVAYVANGEEWQRDFRFAESFGLLGWLVLASLADKLIVDFVAVLVGLGKIRREFQRENWDLICMTNISTRRILTAKHALAQVNIWRMTSIIIGIRLGLVVIFLFQIFIAPGLIFGQRFNPGVMRPSELLSLMTIFTAFLVIAGVYVVEPRWRIRVLTAGSLAVSSQLLSSTFTLLSALGTVVGFWISQAFLAGLLSFLTWMLLSGSAGIFIDSAVVASMFVLAYVILAGGTLYFGYRGMESLWLHNAERRLIQRGGMR